MTVPVAELLLFMLAVGVAALYGLTIMWGTIAVMGIAVVAALSIAWHVLPWYAIVIGGGAMLLAAPLLLRPFPDWFVNGRAGLLTFAAAGVAAVLVMWAAA
jgi:hypothetical protein